jgi:hypothetical protein
MMPLFVCLWRVVKQKKKPCQATPAGRMRSLTELTDLPT